MGSNKEYLTLNGLIAVTVELHEIAIKGDYECRLHIPKISDTEWNKNRKKYCLTLHSFSIGTQIF
jgi:hypothetical protein